VALVLGRLPLRYRITVWVAGLVSFAGVGAWLAHRTSIPLMWSSGAAVAVLVGALAIASFLHLLTTDAHSAPVASRSARYPRHRG
jgi:glycerol-3-phosphate acyltransferase PlsY